MRTLPPLLLLLILMVGCNTSSSSALLSENEAIDAVYAVPYVAETSARVAKLGDPNIRAVLIPQGEHEAAGTPFLTFQFAESRPDLVFTITWIRVNRRTGEVLFEDTAGDCAWLKPDEWLKRTASVR